MTMGHDSLRDLERNSRIKICLPSNSSSSAWTSSSSSFRPGLISRVGKNLICWTSCCWIVRSGRGKRDGTASRVGRMFFSNLWSFKVLCLRHSFVSWNLESTITPGVHNHLWISTICLQRLSFSGPVWSHFTLKVTTEQRSHVNNGHYFEVSSSRVFVYTGFNCMCLKSCLFLIMTAKIWCPLTTMNGVKRFRRVLCNFPSHLRVSPVFWSTNNEGQIYTWVRRTRSVSKKCRPQTPLVLWTVLDCRINSIQKLTTSKSLVSG